jgi:hypothetical protein
MNRAAVSCLVLLAALVASVLFLVLATLHGLLTELADEARASRREGTDYRNNVGGNMSSQKLWDSTSALRAANARLAASIGSNSSQARGELSDARQLAAELALHRRAS